MPKIYEYLGLIFYFYSDEHEPIHVHVTKAERETIFELIMENGQLLEIKKKKSTFKNTINSQGGERVLNFY